jgi:deazaflavin-dependent oxidoreductase (nitroreductase family)
LARSYAVTGRVRFINRLVRFLNRFGLAGSDMRILTTVGRKSGLERSTPITLAERDGARYLVSPYGEVGWVHNIRANGTATLGHRDVVEVIEVDEVHGAEAAAVLHQYVSDTKVVQPFFDTPPDAPPEAFTAESRPVFRIR